MTSITRRSPDAACSRLLSDPPTARPARDRETIAGRPASALGRECRVRPIPIPGRVQ